MLSRVMAILVVLVLLVPISGIERVAAPCLSECVTVAAPACCCDAIDDDVCPCCVKAPEDGPKPVMPVPSSASKPLSETLRLMSLSTAWVWMVSDVNAIQVPAAGACPVRGSFDGVSAQSLLCVRTT